MSRPKRQSGSGKAGLSRIFAVLLTGAAALALPAGCGSPEQTASAPGNGNVRQSQAAEESSPSGPGSAQATNGKAPGDAAVQSDGEGAEDLIGPDSGPIDMSAYDLGGRSIVQTVLPDRMTWQSGAYKVKAEVEQYYGEPAGEGVPLEAAKVGAITVEGGALPEPVALKNELDSLVQVSFSADGRYLALIGSEAGPLNPRNQLLILDLAAGTYEKMSGVLEKWGGGAGSAHTSAWSPEGHTLALTFGDAAENRFALYDPQTKELSGIAAGDFYSVAILVWSKNGDFLDWIGENPSDRFGLYRYTPRTGGIERLRDAGRAELMNAAESLKGRIVYRKSD
ncbi:hypothetical protein QWJ34_09860 [Saccharibacillus sp. CPCC 101409]|uniref:hypothetical protein n=1 Tax=Saccharibacillus sp. CPCC 101409 TaxID=3058041 RepID=UPI00267401E5|nr:hypothetical protein [Saccharibacillus sp. CPCC 101409]MDO3410065.1 hypothetical protein [Saccharibacillus sp. CPCC 101409]